MNSKVQQKYNAKANTSFKTKWTLFVFECIINPSEPSVEGFKQFVISRSLVTKFTNEYWQKERTEKVDGIAISDIIVKLDELTKKTSNETYQKCKENYLSNYHNIFDPNDFEELLDNKSCKYCGVTNNEVIELAADKKINKKSERGWNLEIDRIDSNYEYTKENCVMACYWCNNAKTDEFTFDEFIEIGKSISKIWRKRLDDSRQK